ncbi:uncharacterized protein SCHCODRAFT_061049 [Schizophyllum commune H4-8]|uniref:Glycosyltransferase family 32 protein n=1 Tax=Schizophyllum commune (strain H4-8 / FGSC 9210) TaxID=578458 RepID=D8QHE8_SCHCM|nr:uncharacterized protein SCHCODRAFT_061049 [Schizophyllum commune H4-8]KAI5887158.1 hypothetical protein SCHCODRAFT_061049 [Schizophyllum commune H4-8]
MGRFWRSLILLGLPLLLLLFGLYFYEPHIEIAFYSRRWVAREIEELAPLGGCFSADRPSSGYNISQHVYGAKKTEIHAGLPMRVGLDCYNFAGTIEGPTMYDLLDLSVGTLPVDQRTQYHTYWRADLAPFGQRQEWMLKSFFATQNIARTRLVLWSNGDLSHNPILQKYVRSFPNAFAIQRIDIPGLAKGTELDGVLPLLQTRDDKAWIDGDLIRLLVLWNYGGVWVDMDSLLTRDLEPLLEHEFVTQWDCYDKPYTPFNGALMRFRRHSPYICEAFHIMATSPPPRPKSTDWGSLLYFKLWRRLVAVGIPPFKVLPFCFTEGRSCRLDTRLPDPFVTDADNRRGVKPLMGLDMDDGGDLDLILTRKIFGIHLHNQWEKLFPPGGWVERLLLKKYDERLNGVMNT